MNKEDRKVIKSIMQNNDLEMNLPAYANSYMNKVYEYSLIHLVLNYYTIKEMTDESGHIDDSLTDVLEQLHGIIYQTILSKELCEDFTTVLESIDKIRNDLTAKMKVLTSYTDTLQLYEYILNRVEYGITGENYPVEESELAAKVFQYLFNDNDTMVINSKIQMVTAQLPIRMTKNRFYDYLTDTLNIYKGSEKTSLDDFLDMLKSTALLELPDGYETQYPQIVEMIKILEQTDYKALDSVTFKSLMEQFLFTTGYLSDLVTNYLLVMEIVNDLYAVLLAMPYEKNDSKEVLACIQMIKGLHDAFISASDISEMVDEGFEVIEGRQEELGEEVLQFESVLSEIMLEHKDTINWIMSDKIFNCLDRISKLLSNSLFIDLEANETEVELADADYIRDKRDEIVALLSAYFDVHTKEMNRAVMAALFSSMPVLFNSQQEIKDYIEYSLNHCSNKSELMACAKILEDLMDEE